ncbi:MAG: anti-sigma factor RsbA family regulatory protein [Solirubrobacteraceae bacterium]
MRVATHHAFFYRGASEYLDGVRRFIDPGLDAGEPVIAAVPSPRLELLRESLASESGAVELVDMSELGRNPGRIIPAVHGMLARHAGRRLHYIGEPIWPGRAPDEIREATRHEALINIAWPQAPIRVLCPYDADGLDEAVIADAERTHPHVLDGEVERPGAAYAEDRIPEGCDTPLPAPPAHAETLQFGRADLSRLRRLVATRALHAGLGCERVEDLELAISEIATNTLRHSGAGGTLHVWVAAGRLSCQVEDAGHITDPLAGRRPRTPDALDGRGLWIVHSVCDLVEVRTGEGGTTVRLHMHCRARDGV